MNTHPPDDSTPPRGGIRRPSWVDRIQRVHLAELLDKYRRRMVHAETGLPFEPTRRPAPYTIEALAFETRGTLQVVLKVFFPFCLALFGLSFLWDVQGLVRSVSVAGMIGFGTNWIAIKMLFWPREARPVFGRGLIPSQRDQLVEKVADEVLENLINEQLILERIEDMDLVPRLSRGFVERLRGVVADPDFKRDLRNLVLTWVGDLASDPAFRDRLADRAERSLEEFAGRRFTGWLVRRLKEIWRPPLVEALNQELEDLEQTVTSGIEPLDEVIDNLPAAIEARQEQIDRVLTTMLVGIVREVDVRAIVLEQLSTITTEQLESGFREFSDDKLSYITLLGGVFGLIGGTVIVWPLPSVAVLAALGLLLTALDLALQPLMGSRYYPKKGAGDPDDPPV